MKQLYERIALLYYGLATAFLMLLALVLLGTAVWELAPPSRRRGLGVLDSAGLVIIGFAIVETSKFIAEEEISAARSCARRWKARRSLTKFITIIVIAASLEALVMVFETSRTDIRRLDLPGEPLRRLDVRSGRRSVCSSGCRAASPRRRAADDTARTRSTTTAPSDGEDADGRTSHFIVAGRYLVLHRLSARRERWNTGSSGTAAPWSRRSASGR